jgi:hypothetical protein
MVNDLVSTSSFSEWLFVGIERSLQYDAVNSFIAYCNQDVFVLKRFAYRLAISNLFLNFCGLL